MDRQDSSNSYSHILKYIGLFGGVQGLNILIGIVRNKLVATILGPAGMGLISLFNSTISLVSNTTNLGIPMSAVRNISEYYATDDVEKLSHAVRLVRSWALLTALFGMLLCIVLSPILSYWTFGWGNHTLHFVLLSPIVAMLAIIGGEMAILKGARQLKKLAAVSVYNVIAALITSVPIYLFYGESGIVPSLIIMAGCQMLFTIIYSYRLFPLRLSCKRKLLNEGFPMIRIGLAFVGAGILGSGAEFIIRSFLNFTSSLDTLGLYTAGYTMTMTYASLVFSAMETDFFPRLSTAKDNITERNLLINRQMEVSLLLVSPILVGFMFALPILTPLLYSTHFLPAQGMMQIMILAMFMRAVKLPVSYLPLAKGDSMVYLMLEAIYDITIVVAVIIGFNIGGLTGCGAAITIVGALEFFLIIGYARYKYKYILSSAIKRYMFIQLPIGLTAYLITFVESIPVYWISGVLLTTISAAISYELLRRNSVPLPPIFHRLTKKNQ